MESNLFSMPTPLQMKQENVCDIIDLDGPDKTSEEIVFEWDAKIRKQFTRMGSADSYSKLESLMREYLKSLREEAIEFEDFDTLRTKMLSHIKYIHLFFIELDTRFVDNYLETMEDILTAYVNAEMQMVMSKKKVVNKREYKRLLTMFCRRVIHALNIYLLGNEENILHVLIKLNADPKMQPCSDALNDLYMHFLTKIPTSTESDEAFCRAYILFQKWKEIKRTGEREQLDTIMYKMYNRTPDSIKNSETLQQILMPKPESTIDLLLHISGSTQIISKEYFKYIKAQKICAETKDPTEAFFDDVDVLPTLDNEEDEEFCQTFNEMVKNFSSLTSQHGNDKDEVVDAEIVTECKQEIDDDIRIVSVSNAVRNDIIYEIGDDSDDDVCAIVHLGPKQPLPKKEKSTSFLDSIQIPSNNSNKVDRCKKPREVVRNVPKEEKTLELPPQPKISFLKSIIIKPSNDKMNEKLDSKITRMNVENCLDSIIVKPNKETEHIPQVEDVPMEETSELLEDTERLTPTEDVNNIQATTNNDMDFLDTSDLRDDVPSSLEDSLLMEVVNVEPNKENKQNTMDDTRLEQILLEDIVDHANEATDFEKNDVCRENVISVVEINLKCEKQDSKVPNKTSDELITKDSNTTPIKDVQSSEMSQPTKEIVDHHDSSPKKYVSIAINTEPTINDANYQISDSNGASANKILECVSSVEIESECNKKEANAQTKSVETSISYNKSCRYSNGIPTPPSDRQPEDHSDRATETCVYANIVRVYNHDRKENNSDNENDFLPCSQDVSKSSDSLMNDLSPPTHEDEENEQANYFELEILPKKKATKDHSTHVGRNCCGQFTISDVSEHDSIEDISPSCDEADICNQVVENEEIIAQEEESVKFGYDNDFSPNSEVPSTPETVDCGGQESTKPTRETEQYMNDFVVETQPNIVVSEESTTQVNYIANEISIGDTVLLDAEEGYNNISFFEDRVITNDNTNNLVANNKENLEINVVVGNDKKLTLPPATVNGKKFTLPAVNNNKNLLCNKELMVTVEKCDFNKKSPAISPNKVVYTASSQKIKAATLDEFSRFELSVHSRWNQLGEEKLLMDGIFSGPVTKMNGTSLDNFNGIHRTNFTKPSSVNDIIQCPVVNSNNSRSNSPTDYCSPEFENIDDLRTYFQETQPDKISTTSTIKIRHDLMPHVKPVKSKKKQISFNTTQEVFEIPRRDNYGNSDSLPSSSNSKKPRKKRLKINKRSLKAYGIKESDKFLNDWAMVPMKRLSAEQILKWTMGQMSTSGSECRPSTSAGSVHSSTMLRVDYDKRTVHLNDKDVVLFNSSTEGSRGRIPTPPKQTQGVSSNGLSYTEKKPTKRKRSSKTSYGDNPGTSPKRKPVFRTPSKTNVEVPKRRSSISSKKKTKEGL